ncbi:MAG: hypothetical protein R3B96_06775 [Pirellulaceae bacterium]
MSESLASFITAAAKYTAEAEDLGTFPRTARRLPRSRCPSRSEGFCYNDFPGGLILGDSMPMVV